MRILFFIRTFFGGGAEKVLLDYVKGLNNEKMDITVMVRYPEGALKEQFLALREQGIHVRWCFDHLKPGKNLFEKAGNALLLRLADWSAYRCPKLFYRLAIREKYDVEIAFMHMKRHPSLCHLPTNGPKNCYGYIQTCGSSILSKLILDPENGKVHTIENLISAFVFQVLRQKVLKSCLT